MYQERGVNVVSQAPAQLLYDPGTQRDLAWARDATVDKATALAGELSACNVDQGLPMCDAGGEHVDAET